MDPKADEISAVVEEIRRRVRGRNPNGTVLGDIPLPNLTPLLHARDGAEGKVASIGTVNPRRPGLLNSLVQTMKRQVSRALDWHVREQVEFNRAALRCVQSTIEALNESNRALAALASRIEQTSAEAREVKDIRSHWDAWRDQWERKLTGNEIHFLRGVSELQASFQHRVTLMDANYREQLNAQHTAFESAMKAQHDHYEATLSRITDEVQRRFWSDLDKVRLEYQAMIHSELRLVRQKASLARKADVAVPNTPADFSAIDWFKFAEKFRGSEESVKERQRIYADRFQGCGNVLDIGCGRGELLEVLRDAGIPARGIDLSEESVALCHEKGLDAAQADLFSYLKTLPGSYLDGIVSSQVVEHLPPERLPELVRLAQEKLKTGGLLAIETPNPECLAIFGTHFYLDPTHQRPIPPALMAFYLEEAGFGGIEVRRLSPAIETIPSVAALPEDFRNQFFGEMDYAIFGRKLQE